MGRGDEVDVRDTCGRGEQVECAMRADEFLVGVEGEEYVGWSAAVGDVDRAVLGGPLRAAGALVELSTAHLRRHHTLAGM